MVVLVTGANGQLGQAIQFVAGKYSTIDFVFCNSSELDITNLVQCKAVFDQYKPNFCVNTAAYTAVDKAESEPEKAFAINTNGAENLALTCKEFDTILLHISTDFVFDAYFLNGKAFYDRELRLPLKSGLGLRETDVPFPTGIYGLTKLQGEQVIQGTWEKHFIIRTSWVYSQFGNNFIKTMLRLASEKDSLSVVNDQIGTPTNAVDLSEALIKIILSFNVGHSKLFGIYNFSNEGKCTWYDFAKEIFRINNIQINLKPIETKEYPTPAKRPKYSVLDKTKIKTIFGIKINDWRDSLSVCLQQLKKYNEI
ncbi:dTDP-4-dehydrorhamnose reductase [Flavobacterium sediminilitoris]|uniref:dTDP-4-dehydrorhamnose reductase n=1 Tax=Flavobacterium sediminilitoris TaxID=2024526 RepID=A0ABY4HPX0_9FLAO|nr:MULTISPECIES: dTDP-4-dehydrorhamnose reductase [Flavobacterium]UOX34932.1 dTDP-4-dehydrorhamnose reductase [Flavobacterium sediminilitoris]